MQHSPQTQSDTSDQEVTQPPRKSPMVVLGLVLALMFLVALSFVLSGHDTLTAAGDTPQVGAIPVVKSTTVPAGSDPTYLPASPSVGKLAPDFTWTGTDGRPVRLSGYRGQVVLINFWATWCPPCKAEMPEIEAYWKENRDKGVMILAVNVGDEDETTIRSFMQKNKLTFQALNDTSGQVASAYRIGGIPASYFVDPQGVIRDTVVGGMTKGIVAAKMARMQ